MAKFKYKIGEVLKDKMGEVVVVTNTYTDYHTYKSDYEIEVLVPGKGMHRAIGQRFYLDRTICESWFLETTDAEKVLYGR